jgi:DNA-binding transcriptional MerR regulator
MLYLASRLRRTAMSEAPTQIEIPDRALFKASEVCELVKLQPYVLRSWEAEFPQLGISKNPSGPRVYRRADIEQVIRIKHLLLVEGLTLAGARRKLEEESMPVAADAPVLDELIGRNARERLTEVKRGLRSILELLSGRGSVEPFGPPITAHPSRGSSNARRVPPGRTKAPRNKAAGPRNAVPARRKRSA